MEKALHKFSGSGILKRGAALVGALVMTAGLLACGGTKKTYSVVGTWKSDSGKIGEITFEEDGSGTLKKSSEISVNMTYSIDGENLTVTTEVLKQKQETTYTYTVTADKLTLTEGSETTEFTKQ